MASASIEPVNAVESFRSVKTSVTNLRTSVAGRIGAVVAGRDGAGARRLPKGRASLVEGWAPAGLDAPPGRGLFGGGAVGAAGAGAVAAAAAPPGNTGVPA